MHIVDRIFKAIGGATVIATQTGDPVQTVHDWLAYGNIPHWRRPAVVDAARRLDKQLDPDMLAYLASRERSPRKQRGAESQAA